MIYWLILVIAGLFEVVWAVSLKLSRGFSDPLWSSVTVAGLIFSMAALAYSVKHLPLGTAYAVWTGIGAIGTAILGIFLFNESRDPLRLFFICLIFIGIAGLRLSSPGSGN